MIRGYGSGFTIGFQPVITNLIIINALLYLLKATLMPEVLDQHLGLYNFSSPNFRPWQLLTHMFMHADFGHLLGNMFGLFMFGNTLERLWGPQRLLFYYLATGLGAAFLQQGVNAWEFHRHMAQLAPYGFSVSDIQHLSRLPMDKEFMMNALQELYERSGVTDQMAADVMGGQVMSAAGDLLGPMIGASGAVFGILIGFGMMLPNEVIYAPGLFIPLKAKYVVAIYGLIELFQGVRPMAGDSVAHYAHLGGMIFGYLLMRYWKRTTIL
jgi:rhomboid-like protein